MGSADRGSAFQVRRSYHLAVMAFVWFGLILVLMVRNGRAQPYAVETINFGLFAGAGGALGLNDFGDVVGFSSLNLSFLFRNVPYDDSPGDYGILLHRARLFIAGQPLNPNLHELSLSSAATDINNAGQVVGVYGSPRPRAFLLSSGQIIDIGCFPTNHPNFPHGIPHTDCRSYARGMNDQGQIVGRAAFLPPNQPVPFQQLLPQQAFLYNSSHGVWTNLGVLGGFQASTATAINERGDVVGYHGQRTASGIIHNPHAFFYRNGHIIDIGAAIGATSQALGVNNAGQAVGSYVTADGNSRGFLYNVNNGTAVDLGVLPPRNGAMFTGSIATAINDSGDIVGNSTSNSDLDEVLGEYIDGAFLYRNGQLYNLNDLLVPGSGCRILRAWGINNSGQIVGHGECRTRGMEWWGILLTPEPACTPAASLALTGTAAQVSANVCPAPQIQVAIDSPLPNQTEPLVGQKVIFTPQLNGLTGVTRWVWDFGDGSTLQEGTNRPVEHIYTAKETFPVSLTLLVGGREIKAENQVVVHCDLDPQKDAALVFH